MLITIPLKLLKLEGDSGVSLLRDIQAFGANISLEAIMAVRLNPSSCGVSLVAHIASENTPTMCRTVAYLQSCAHIGFGDRREQREIPVFIFESAAEDQVTCPYQRSRGIKVAQVAALQEGGIHVLVAVMQLQTVARAEMVR
jgi:hypothetical protein